MRSMTGFAVGESSLGGGRVLAEIRSLNHRFLEIRVRLPPELGDHAFFVEQAARERLQRGRFDLGVRLEGPALPPPRFDAARLAAAHRALSELRDQLDPGAPLPLASLLGLPGVLTPLDALDADSCRQALLAAVTAAIARLDAVRAEEGAALAAELRERLEAARRLRAELARQRQDSLAQHRTRTRERVLKLAETLSLPLEPGRLEAEVALLADRADLTEELVRLSLHFDQFDRLLDATEPVGRRLDFLLQEVAREANTLGAKAQDAESSHLVVELKAEVERLREQVQNVE